MTLLYPGSVLATLTELTQVNRTHALLRRVKDLSVNEFVCLLDFITAEFQQFLRAIELINNEALETMLEKVLEAITLKIGQILQAEHTAIFLVDYDKGQLWSKVPQDNTQKFLEIRTPITVGIPGYVASTGQYLNISETYTHPLFSPELEKQMGYKIHNILCMPVISSKNQTVAVVQLANKTGNVPFNHDDEERFRDFAASIGIILESCQSFYVAARNQRGATALLRATQTLGQSLDLEATLQIVMEQARILMQADRSTLFLYRKELNELWTKVAVAADGTNLIEIRIPANRGIAGYVASTGEALNISDAYKDPRFDPTTDKKTGYVTRNILCLPVFNSANELIGVTQLINKQQNSFTASDEEFMRAFNNQAGIALENARLFENVLLEKQYQKDILQSLSDAVISTDMAGQIVTINDAALELLGCPIGDANSKNNKLLWEQNLIGRLVWEVVPIENLQMRLEDSLKTGARHYVPEQSLILGLYQVLSENQDGLNAPHFETMVEAVFNHEGTLDKFIGDALMAVFGAPLPLTENHAWRAVQSALDMRRRLKEFNQRRIIQAQPQIRVGIGISSGDVVSANIGSRKRMDYTVIGDGVNLSSRLEAVTKDYGCDILLSEFTYQLCSDRIWVRQLDKIRVKGKHQAVNIYELIGDRTTPLDAKTQEFLFHYHTGRAAYLSRNFSQAIACFQAAKCIQPQDQAVDIHLERARNYKQTPPPESWDGVWAMLTK
ncbi:MAG: GAF domain-containing protein [Nostoc sp.]|uniref:GAF domain-containing protein n=1 Tax=Nostoc sp. TaxID=1180 RepID=UPI002FF5323F